MDDESTPTAAEEAGAPGADEAAPESGAPATPPEDGYEKRYTDLRTEFDRRNSLIDRARSGDSEALRELTGFEFAQDEEEPPEEGGEEFGQFQDPRVDALIQERQQEQGQAMLRDVDGHIDVLLDEAKVELPQPMREALFTYVWGHGGGFEIQPQKTVDLVGQWLKSYEDMTKSAGEAYFQSKRNAPRVSPGGTGATERPYRADMSLDERIAAAQEQARLQSEQ